MWKTVHAFVHYLIIHLSNEHQASLYLKHCCWNVSGILKFIKENKFRLGSLWISRHIKMKQAFCHGCNTFGAWSIIMITLHGCMHTYVNMHTTPYTRLLLRESLLICFFCFLLSDKTLRVQCSFQLEQQQKVHSQPSLLRDPIINLIYQGLWKW